MIIYEVFLTREIVGLSIDSEWTQAWNDYASISCWCARWITQYASLQGVINQATANLTVMRIFPTFKIQVMESTEQLVRPFNLPIDLTEKI